MQMRPGWYQDSEDQWSLRYWDGQRWTDQRAPKPPPPPQKTDTWAVARGVALGILGVIAILVLLAQAGVFGESSTERELRELVEACQSLRDSGVPDAQMPPECFE